MPAKKKKYAVREWINRHITKPYTIVMVPDNLDKTIQFRLRIGVVTIGMAVMAGTLISAAVFAYYSSRYYQVGLQNRILISSNEEQREQLAILQGAQEQLEAVREENDRLAQEYTLQERQIEELSLMVKDTMEQIEEMLLMQNELRLQLGMDRIESMGGPQNVSRSADEPTGEQKRETLSLDEMSEQLVYVLPYMDSQKEGLLEIGEQMDFLNSIPARWPVESRNITSEFGSRDNPFGGSSTESHWGIDVGCDWGSPIYASGKGSVITAEWESGYGYSVVIDHGYGYTSRYSHCSSLLVAEGDTVEAGERIALVGSTGRSTGPHLDFRIQYNGEYIDPLSILRQ